MDGGCCIARYADNGAYDMSKVNRIMLKFRPIAPKPVAVDGSGSAGSSPEMSDSSPRGGRGKRKCNGGNSNGNNVKKGSNGCGNRKRKASSEEKVDTSLVTLPLLPEAPERKENPAGQSNGCIKAINAPTWLSFGSGNMKDCKDHKVASGAFGVSSDQASVTPTVTPKAMKMLGSCVTVECVTDTWVDGDGLGCTDEEIRVNLGRDTCPGFISDGFGRVTWTNESYRNMVGQQVGDNMVVWLVMKEMVTVSVTLAGHGAFSCWVRVQQYCNNTHGSEGWKEKSSIIVPCDAWRMECGGFAWRLDVKAALCLGR